MSIFSVGIDPRLTVGLEAPYGETTCGVWDAIIENGKGRRNHVQRI